MPITETLIDVTPGQQVSGLLQQGSADRGLLVLGHGAGAGMHHPFMQDVAELLAQRDIATLRYQFPYMQRARKSPDSRKTLLASVRAAIDHAHELRPGLPLFAGGKSMGGRMTSLAMAEQPDERLGGLVFIGFPLHNAGARSNERADHLFNVPMSLLFLQGTRDKLSDLTYLQPVCKRLGQQATLHLVEGGDHSFGMLKRAGRTQADALAEIADEISTWMLRLSN